MTRSEAREQAFIVLFEKIFDNDSSISDIIEKAKETENVKINGFAENLLTQIETNCEAVDNTIEENIKGWSINRLPKVSLAILRLAIGEMMFVEEVPTGVSVNEAVELTKKYGTSDDAAYINGVLGAVAKKL